MKKIVLIFIAFYSASILCMQRSNDLIEACKKGDFEMVQALITSGADVNQTGTKGSTPLILATIHNKPEICRLLLESGANIDDGDDLNVTPLMIACAKSYEKVVIVLLSHNPDLNKVDNGKAHVAALYWATRQNNANICALLLKNGAQSDLLSNYYDSPFYWAIQKYKCQKIPALFIKYKARFGFNKIPISQLKVKNEEKEKVLKTIFSYCSNLSLFKNCSPIMKQRLFEQYSREVASTKQKKRMYTFLFCLKHSPALASFKDLKKVFLLHYLPDREVNINAIELIDENDKKQKELRKYFISK